ncbi:MAG: DUF11 domain-containing protein, partial [Armatimonadetes bacterium]|nr:DUF11 domain-containing protein [Armatimonadota bacterium]
YAGQYENTVRVGGPTLDPSDANNAAILTATVFVQPRPDRIGQVRLYTSDMVYNPVSKLLYASVPDSAPAHRNRIAVIDPATGEIQAAVPIGEKPGKLALSDDGQYLYVALGSGGVIRRLDLRMLTPGLQFSLGTDMNGSPVTVGELSVLPGSPDSVVVATPIGSNSFYTLMIYDNGVRRPKMRTHLQYTGLNVASPTTLYGIASSRIDRMSVTAEGISVVEGGHTLFHQGYDGELVYDGGFLFHNSGWVIDPEARHYIGRFTGLNALTGKPYGGFKRVAPDMKAGRVMFLASDRNHPDEEFVTRILAFDPQTYRLLGELDVPGVRGDAGKLLRWGEDGLAFRTPAGQIYLLRTSLLKPPAGAVDLAVEQKESQDPAVVNRPFSYSVTVTNRGAQTATGVILTDALPAGASFVSAVPSQGSCSQAGGKVECSLGVLGPGADATILLTVTPTRAGTLNHRVQIGSAEFDTDTGNNVSLQATRVEAALSADAPRISRVTLPTNDLVYRPSTRTFYASVPGHGGSRGNTLTALDPFTGTLGPSVYLGSEPGRLEITDDGGFIYAALGTLPAVRRIALDEGRAEAPFLLGRFLYIGPHTGYDRGPFYALDMEAVPGNSSSVAVLRRNSLGGGDTLEGVAIYDNGVQRPVTMDRSQEEVSQIEYSDTASVLYGFDNSFYRPTLYRLAADASGVTLLNRRQEYFVPASEYERAGNLIYSSAGQVIDPETHAVVGSFEGIPPLNNFQWGAVPLVEPDLSTGRVFFLLPLMVEREVRGCRILVYDLRTRIPLGTIEVPDATGAPSRLTRWGADGLAFLTSENQVFFIRSPLIPPAGAAADLSVDVTVGSETAQVGFPISYTLTVANRGPEAGSGVRLAGQFSPHVTDLKFGPGAESCQVTGSGYACALGSLAKDAAVTFTLAVTPTAAGEIAHSVWVAGDRADPEPTNDRASTTVRSLFDSRPESIRYVGLATTALVYDPARQLIYASVPGKGVMRIDPYTGSFGETISIGIDPGALALDPSGTYLYVGVGGGTKVQRVNLASGLPDLRFPVLGTDLLLALPGRPESLVAGKRAPYNGPLVHFSVYDNGNPRYPAAISEQLNLFDMTISDAPHQLYGVEKDDATLTLYQLDLEADRIMKRPIARDLVGGHLRYDGGLVIGSALRVADPMRKAFLGYFPNVHTSISRIALMAPDANSGRVFFLHGEHAATSFSEVSYSIKAFDLKADDSMKFPLAGTVPLPGPENPLNLSPLPGSDLILWGHDGLAFRSWDDRISLIRTPLRRLLGDADGNGVLNVQDAVMVLRAVVGVLSFTAAEADRGDFNQDRSVNVTDAVEILRKSVGL